MNIKEKKCKSIGIAKGFDSCGKLTLVRKYGMCYSCYSNWLLNTEAGKEKIERSKIKATEPRKKLETARKDKTEFSKLGTLISNTVIACHKYIRQRDKYKPCISCGEPWNESHQAGHFYKAELFSSIRLNEFNINGQCTGCNIRKEGNESQYRVNLPKRIGLDQYDELNRLAGLEKQINFKWSRTELIRIGNYYKQKLKEL